MALLEKAVEVQIEECAHVQFWVPPLVLPDGRKLTLKDAQGNFPPISFLIPDGDNGPVKARFHPVENRWELVED